MLDPSQRFTSSGWYLLIKVDLFPDTEHFCSEESGRYFWSGGWLRCGCTVGELADFLRAVRAKKPALVLTTADVSAARLTKHDLTKNNLGVHYMVTLHLTKEARDKLAATVEGKPMRLLTVVVDRKYWRGRRYEKDKDAKFVPEEARAETFLPDVGFFSSEAEAQRLVDAFK